MELLIKKSKSILQKFVDSIAGIKADTITGISYIIILIYTMVIFNRCMALIKVPVITNPLSPKTYAFLIAFPVIVFCFSMAGDYFQKPSRRVVQFLYVVLTTAIITVGYFTQQANLGFLKFIYNIKNIEVIPYSLLEGNIRLISFGIPLLIVIPALILAGKIIFSKKIRQELAEYRIDALTPVLFPCDDTTIDIKICEDIYSGEECIVPEKKLYEHTYLQGSTGSGKTATYIRPVLGQLMELKSVLRERQKEIAYECLNEDIAYLTAPISNHYMNNHFNPDMIKPKEGKETRYIEKFKKYLVGVREKDEKILTEKFGSKDVELEYPKGDDYYSVKVKIYTDDILIDEIETRITNNKLDEELKIANKSQAITIYSGLIAKNNDDEETAKRVKDRTGVLCDNNGHITITFPKLGAGITYEVSITKRGSGKLIYKGIGATIIAPDGGLAKDAINIGEKYNVKFHKIDPQQDEIDKGYISRFNPLKGDRPEKTGDIISSILVSMDQDEGDGGKSYFVNASVRAVRNLIILLKVMYPRINGCDPTLVDVLNVLNDFNLSVPLVEAMKRDEKLRARWGSVIDYFETSFYSPEVDDRGKVIIGQTKGSQRKKTEEAISGIINQLDNFLGREEIRYILCPRDEESLILKDVLENGECIAIATRQNDLGQRLGRAFALFFILSLQNEILSRYSEDENPEVPHFLLIDEFPFYLNDNTKVFFTFARKYRCSVTIAIQNMGQLKAISNEFAETIFANTNTKMLLPGANVEDRKYWSEFFGMESEMVLQTGVSSSSIMSTNPNYTEQRRGSVQEKEKVSTQKTADLEFKQAYYCYTDKKGKTRIGKGRTDFLILEDRPKAEIKTYDWAKFNPEDLDEYLFRKKLLEAEEQQQKKEIRKGDPNLLKINNRHITEVADDTDKIILSDYPSDLTDTDKAIIGAMPVMDRDVNIQLENEIAESSINKNDIISLEYDLGEPTLQSVQNGQEHSKQHIELQEILTESLDEETQIDNIEKEIEIELENSPKLQQIKLKENKRFK